MLKSEHGYIAFRTDQGIPRASISPSPFRSFWSDDQIERFEIALDLDPGTCRESDNTLDYNIDPLV